tara:strand:+ start:81 stop:617 length:537 start_codon:yes stop_codon:yes gene_type:complete
MYAIVEIAGLQYKVQKDQRVYVHRLEGTTGDKITLDRVLLAEEKNTVTVGAPVIQGASITASILNHVKADKLIVFKKKRRKGYTKKTGHRQPMTEISILDISLSPKRKTAVEKKSSESAASKPVKKVAGKDAETKKVKEPISKKVVPVKKAAVKKKVSDTAVKKPAKKVSVKKKETKK